MLAKLVIQTTTPRRQVADGDLTNHINVIIQFLIDCRPRGEHGQCHQTLQDGIGSIHPGTPDLEAKKILVEPSTVHQDKILDASDLILTWATQDSGG